MALRVFKMSKAISNIVACLSVQFHLISLIQHCITAVDCISINLEDILNSQMMPARVFLMRSNDKLVPNYIQDFLPALQVMAYHRKMMQQFLASDYLSKEILNWKLETNDSIIRKRVGKLQKVLNLSTDEAPDDTSKKLLFDNGSSNYNAWLQRTTTLDDIRHQLSEAGKVSKGNENRIQRRKMSPVTRTTLVTYLEDEECDDGDITGYAYDTSRHEPSYFNPHPQAISLMPRLSLKKSYFVENPEQISKIGYDDHTQPEHSSAVTQATKQIKEISLKDITDIALTTLAFLSFGMFILQVLMCITMSKDDSNNLMMLPMEATEAIDTNDGTEEIRRRKRSILQKQETLLGVNQLSQILLMKIEHLYFNEYKNSNSAFDYQKLCKYSAFLRTSPNIKKNIWTTLYSLGTSWLAARLSDDYMTMIKRLAHVFDVCG